MHVSPNLDVERVPLPPGGLHFLCKEKDGFEVPISAIDPNDLTELELQRMIDDSGSN